MKTFSDAETVARFDEVLDSVVDDGEEVVITRAGHAPVVMLVLDYYEALKETVHLLRSPANATRLLEAVARLNAVGDRRQKNILLALRDAASEVGGVEVENATRGDQARPVDLS